MALSMEEQRLLSEIASRLTADDPKLAARLSGFGRRAARPKVRLIAAIAIAVIVIATAAATGVAIALA